MFVKCAWCGKEIEEREPRNNKEAIPGMCQACFDELNVPDPVEQLKRMKQKLQELDKKGVLWL